jgi:hypothetical protein
MQAVAANSLTPPISYAGLPARSSTLTTKDLDPNFSNWRQKAQDSALAFQAPLQADRREALESQLANMGLDRGSEAWAREMRTLSDQDARDNLQAFTAGQAETALDRDTALALGNYNLDTDIRAGGFNNANRQQAIAEMFQQRQQPLNEVNALLTGQQVQSPQMPTFNTATQAQPTQYLSAGNSQYNAALGGYGAQMSEYNAALGGYNAQQSASANRLAGLTGIAGLFL